MISFLLQILCHTFLLPLINMIIQHIVFLDILNQRVSHIHAPPLTTQQDMVGALAVAHLEEQLSLAWMTTNEFTEIGYNLLALLA